MIFLGGASVANRNQGEKVVGFSPPSRSPRGILTKVGGEGLVLAISTPVSGPQMHRAPSPSLLWLFPSHQEDNSSSFINPPPKASSSSSEKWVSHKWLPGPEAGTIIPQVTQM